MTRGGGGRREASSAKATDAAMPPSPPTHNEIDYDDKDGGRCHKRGGADDNGKRRE